MVIRDAVVLIVLLSVSSPALGQVDTWETNAEMPTSRVFHASCTIASEIYVFGGQRVGGGDGISSVEAYDPVTDSWHSRADMPDARLGMTASAVDGKCFLIGGTTGPGDTAQHRVDVYDPVTNNWLRRADMPTARMAAASAVMDGKIYVAGGWMRGDILSPATAALEIYDPASNSWMGGPDLPTPRALLAASVVGDEVYFIGGGSAALGSNDGPLVESYSATTNAWTRHQDMPTPRGTLTAATVNDLIHTFGGGFDVGKLSTVEVYDPLTDAWSARTPMTTARWGVTNGLINGKIYVMGGSTERGLGHNSLDTNEAYTAALFAINAGLNDAWYDPDTDGQGFFITVYPDLGAVSLAWFTYDTELPPMDVTANLGDPGHRWLTALGPIVDNKAMMQIEMTSGGIFDTATDITRTDPPGSDGTILLTFDSCNSGTVEYDIPSINQQGIVHIQRVVNDNIMICEALSAD